MTTFHWITLVIGCGVVIAVWIYNWLLERRFRLQHGASAFISNYPDVLVDTPQNFVRHGEELHVPLAASESTKTEPVPAAASMTATGAQSFDSVFYFTVDLTLADAMNPEAAPVIDVGKRVQILGLNPYQVWEPLQPEDTYRVLRIALQLVDRQGALVEAQLSRFCDAVRHFAQTYRGTAVFPSTEEALLVAANLDTFCAAVDKVISLNVVPKLKTTLFSFDHLRSLVEPAGMRLEGDGIFHARSGSGRPLFTLMNRDQQPFSDGQTIQAITFLLDVPHIASGEQAFDQMANLAQQLALTLGGDLVDDENHPLRPVDLGAIRQQLAQIYTQMDEHGIPAGSVAALRLFS